MNDNEQQMLGEIKGILLTMKESHGNQLANLFRKTDDINTQLSALTTKVVAQNGTMQDHEVRIRKVERTMIKAVAIGLALAVGGAGVIKGSELVGAFLK